MTSQELGGTVEHDLPDLENVDADEDLRVDRGAALGGVITYFATQEPP